ncbi:hypothetical protein MLOOGBEN_06485 [Bacillus sp. EB106-08-02-XG196]|uniref:hypothetical protein n=1 Tax=Bacillus sp. EB106-08-02-XG196 TaxID=2737049 RepID=UPI0015C45B4A|nr:hypothetical protein [Bacillus sp. EB106-08-02-XG196]NWQ40346.1 hypothetical protein [Bacillus sp. EB106-08-02-XG196]
MEGGKKEGYQKGVEYVISKILKNKKDMSLDDIAHMVEVDVSFVQKVKTELKKRRVYSFED